MVTGFKLILGIELTLVFISFLLIARWIWGANKQINFLYESLQKVIDNQIILERTFIESVKGESTKPPLDVEKILKTKKDIVDLINKISQINPPTKH